MSIISCIIIFLMATIVSGILCFIHGILTAIDIEEYENNNNNNNNENIGEKANERSVAEKD